MDSPLPDESLQQSVIDNNLLLQRLLDSEMGASANRHNRDPSVELQRMLSLRSIETTDSSASTRRNIARFAGDVSWWKIGFGQCGVVFEITGTPTVLKVAKQHFWEDSLRTDFNIHQAVSDAMSKFNTGTNNNTGVCVPRVMEFLDKTSPWWSESHVCKLKTAGLPDSILLPTFAIISERILPIPKLGRECLIDLYCPQEMRADAKLDRRNNDCIIRVYLGKHKGSSLLAPNFSLRNFNLHVDQMGEDGLKLPVGEFARDMGEALAIMHWGAHVDAYDVEFVMGSSPWYIRAKDGRKLTTSEAEELGMFETQEARAQVNFQKRLTRMWVLDFNLCGKVLMDQIQELHEPILKQFVLGFFENDPYYPLPLMETVQDQELWKQFKYTYLGKAYEILSSVEGQWAGWAGQEKLPDRFIAMCVERERQNLERGKGHGHRDEKQ